LADKKGYFNAESWTARLYIFDQNSQRLWSSWLKSPQDWSSQHSKKTLFRSHLKNRILVQVRGGAEFKTAGILKYFEDFKRGANKEIGPKDIFEIASNYSTILVAGN
jgi:hypothetical protein